MTIAAANAVLDRMEADAAFADRIKDAGGPEASLASLAAEGFDVTAQDLRDAVLDRYRDSLTEEQLDALAAGSDLDDGARTAALFAVGAAGGAVVVAAMVAAV